MKKHTYITALVLSMALPLTSQAMDQSSPANSLVVATDGLVGVGTDVPESALHVKKDIAQIFVENTNVAAGNRQLLSMKNNGGIGMRMNNADNESIWDFSNTNSGNFTASKVGTGGFEFEVQGNGRTKISSFGTLIFDMRSSGNLLIPNGDLIVGGSTLNIPDYVFEHDYKLMPLDELKSFVKKNKHLPNVASEADIKKSKQVNIAKSHMTHLEKIEELTLYTIEQHEQINLLKEQLGNMKQVLQTENSSLKDRLASLEKLVTYPVVSKVNLDVSDKIAFK